MKNTTLAAMSAVTIGLTSARAHMIPVTMTLSEFQEQSASLKIPTHQRQAFAWKTSDVAKMVDTLIRGLCFPAFFVRVKDVKGKERRTLEDGLQRSTTITAFLRGDIGLPSGTIFNMPEDWVNPLSVNGETDEDEDSNELEANQYDASGKRFNELPREIVEQIQATPVVVYEMHNFTDEESRVYFTRLQGGKPLNAAEKRRAESPRLASITKHIVANKMAENFFLNLNLKPSGVNDKRTKNHRLQAEELAVGLLATASGEGMIALTSSTKNNLNDLGLSKTSDIVEKTLTTLGVLGEVTNLMSEEERKLVKATTIAPLFRVTMDEIDDGGLKSKTKIASYTEALKVFLARVNDTAEENPLDSVTDYRNYCSSGSNSQTSLDGRYNILTDELINA